MNEEPTVPPDTIASLPADPHTATTSTSGSNTPTTPPIGTSEAENNDSTSTEQPQEQGAPTPGTMIQYLQPLLANGPRIAELRRKIGHEKGKQWTAYFNEMLDYIIDLRNNHEPPTQLHRNTTNHFGTS